MKLSKLHVNEKFLIYSTYIVISLRHHGKLAALLVCIKLLIDNYENNYCWQKKKNGKRQSVALKEYLYRRAARATNNSR